MPSTQSPRTPQYLKSHQVARMFGVSKRALIKWIETGRIPPPEQDPRNGFYRWTLTDIQLISSYTGRTGGHSR